MWFSVLSKAGGLLVISTVLVACTVVDLDENGKPILPVDPNAVVSDYNQSPDKVASTIWVSKVMPFANSNALSWQQVKQQNQPATGKNSQSHFVRFNGKVVEVETEGREGAIRVAVEGDEQVLQLGPIVKGNAIRDASTFIRFEDFKNQVQYAQLSKALSKRALQDVAKPDASWVGQQVEVLAAVTVAPTGLSNAVPLSLSKESH
ncbi:putative lipoprotein [Yersinia enterocolitica]|uniref:Lipoprotein n=1 Tax=Yersinia enterocolitica serotype O:8 / biotype 1B (strain NCTC 13174 / 8081) TaxID=393305 RepID=A1JJY3_YERE8|nr:DUF2291 family protein [Yersinia enterocolitica]AJI81329.1 hypothetical protein CH47_2667 [Yersinia enterocolitica]AJJ22934.1 hypothetical protein CH49_232 [Yersinia enterocolitica]EKA28925.1 putative lipoprotein [Yersinia enterocolitica subsp. enterocolitica WA-314]ELI8284330.1 DUF2291 family protein [Yersinia enterocolitica]KGA72688.1 hypothetical protein DJ59_3937 [Yersinia enterocolitica]